PGTTTIHQRSASPPSWKRVDSAWRSSRRSSKRSRNSFAARGAIDTAGRDRRRAPSRARSIDRKPLLLVFVEAVVQRPQADPQFRRRRRTVAVVAGQRRQDVLALHLIQRRR